MTTLLAIIIMVPILIVPLYLLEGYTIIKLWEWFIFPTFHIPVPSLLMAIGIATFIGILTNHNIYDIKRNEKNFKESWLELLSYYMRALFYLFFGYILHLFI